MEIEELEKEVKKLKNKACCTTSTSLSLTKDGSSSIKGGVAVDMIRVKGALAALTIGTTDGGTDVLTSTATIVGWNLFYVNAYSETDYKLYFGGITFATQIIIYKR
jgi:hypothetical protein